MCQVAIYLGPMAGSRRIRVCSVDGHRTRRRTTLWWLPIIFLGLRSRSTFVAELFIVNPWPACCCCSRSASIHGVCTRLAVRALKTPSVLHCRELWNPREERNGHRGLVTVAVDHERLQPIHLCGFICGPVSYSSSPSYNTQVLSRSSMLYRRMKVWRA